MLPLPSAQYAFSPRNLAPQTRPTRVGGLIAVCAALILSACAGGGQSPTVTLPPGSTSSQPGTPGQSGDAPEGAPGSVTALTHQGPASLALGDSGLLQPPPDALRAVDGIPVAVLVPLSGRLSGPGNALLQGAQMALFDVRNTEVRLVPIDTAGNPLGAEQAAREAVQRGAKLIVGPLLAESVSAVRPIAEAAGIKVVAFSNSSRVAGGPVFLAGFAPEEQVEAIVAHAMAEGRRKFAILAPSNDYGNVSVDALRDAVTRRGGEFAKVAFYDPDALDFAPQIQRISDYQDRVKALEEQRAELEAIGDEASKRALKRLEVLETWGDPPFDALLLPVLNPQTLQILSAQLAYYDVDQPAVRILGLQRWDSFPALASEPGLIGSRYPAARSSFRERFDKRFAQLYGHPPSELSALAYDVTAVAASLAGDGRRPPRYDVATLTNPDGFIGAEGLFRFTENGMAQRSFAIMEVRKSGVELIQEAPASFDLPQTPAVSQPDLPASDQPATGTTSPIPSS